MLFLRLTEVFRQAAHSRIITTANRINEGMMPEAPAKEADPDFFFVEPAEPERIAATLLEMVRSRWWRSSAGTFASGTR